MAELTPRMKELVQPYLAGIEPYDPNFTPTRINLSANENTYTCRRAQGGRRCPGCHAAQPLPRSHV